MCLRKRCAGDVKNGSDVNGVVLTKVGIGSGERCDLYTGLILNSSNSTSWIAM
jgi:hypothetical protein